MSRHLPGLGALEEHVLANKSRLSGVPRSSRRDVRNPVLALPAAERITRLPWKTRAVLAELLVDLADDARERAQECWRRHKAPMAAYWKAVSVYARHIARVLRHA